MQLPSFLALEALFAVFRHGSVTSAARALHLSQSAVSHRLAALEAELGVELLARSGRGVRMTNGGVRLAQAAGEALSILQTALAAIEPVRSGARQALSISCSPSFAIRFLVPRLASFRSAQPELELHVAADDVPVEPAQDGVAASVRLAAAPRGSLHWQKLIDEVVFPVASPHLLERGPKLAAARDLSHYTLLHDEALAHEPRRVGWAEWLRAAGETRVSASRGVRFSHSYLALEAALAGDGIALARRSLVAEDLVRGRLVTPLALTVPSGLSYWLVTPRALAEAVPPGLPGLRTFLLEALREAAESADRARLTADSVREPAAKRKPARKRRGATARQR
jgi:LysR family glycine cleavage system transcriptional activator